MQDEFIACILAWIVAHMESMDSMVIWFQGIDARDEDVGSMGNSTTE